MDRLRICFCFAFVAVLFAAYGAAGRAGEEEHLTAKQVDARLRLVGDWDAEQDDRKAACEQLEALGWARLHPRLDLRRWNDPSSRRGAIALATRIGAGPSIFHLALQAIRVGNEEGDDSLAMDGIQLLEAALRPGGLESEAQAVERDGAPDADPRRLTWRDAWWPDVLRELHRTRVIVIEGFYSGPGWPSERLESVLTELVHGHEAGLIEAAGHREWRVRMMALPLLGATRTGRTPAVREALRTALRDRVTKVRLAAINAVWGGRWTELVPALGERVLDEQERDEVRVLAVEAVAASGAPAAEATVLRALDAERVEVCAAAAAQASELPRTPTLVAALIENLFDDNPEIRAGAAEGLGGASGLGRAELLDVPVDPEDFLGIINDPSDLVRFRAWEVLAERRAVPPEDARFLVDRLVAGGRFESEGAALALASLGRAAQPVLEAMQEARREVAKPVRSTLSEAIEAVEMSALSVEALQALLKSKEPEARLRAVREVIRRRDVSWLVKLLKSADPQVAIRAAWYLTALPEHTEAVVDTALRVFPDLTAYRGYHIFHRLGDRLDPYLPRVLARYDEEPTDVWFDLLATVKRTEPLLADRVWKAFESEPSARTARRIGQLGERHLSRVLRRLRAADPATRQAAALVFGHLRQWCLRERFTEIQEAVAGLGEQDPARRLVEKALRENNVTGPLGPHHPWLDLR